MTKENIDTLEPGEPHPSAEYALHYISSLGHLGLMKYLEAYSSCGIENNRLAQICAGTINRILKGEPVSDRYLLGLAWSLKSLQEKDLDA
jgi:hypothetical protein